MHPGVLLEGREPPSDPRSGPHLTTGPMSRPGSMLLLPPRGAGGNAQGCWGWTGMLELRHVARAGHMALTLEPPPSPGTIPSGRLRTKTCSSSPFLDSSRACCLVPDTATARGEQMPAQAWSLGALLSSACLPVAVLHTGCPGTDLR